jgi:hypothetical protein
MEKAAEPQNGLKVLIASDVSSRDGIGIELYDNDQIVMEIFRDDQNKTRELSLFQTAVSLELVERGIRIFREEIPWDFMQGDGKPAEG